MFTKNYKIFRMGTFAGAMLINTHPLYQGALISTAGTSRPIFYGNGTVKVGDIGYWLNKGKCEAIPETAANVGDTYGGVFFGSGSTPATENDYTLESPITSGLTVENNANPFDVVKEADGRWSVVGGYILRNTSDAEIVIREIGVVTIVPYSASAYAPCLMERTVFAEPVNIPTGAAKYVEYKFTFNQT